MSSPVFVDGVVVSSAEVTLTRGGAVVLSVRDGGLVEEVTNSAAVVVGGPVSSWTLIGGVLTFEFNVRGAEGLGLPRVYELRLEGPDLGPLSEALLEILSTTCCVVDTPAGRIVQ